jgi:hypothetical protein
VYILISKIFPPGLFIAETMDGAEVLEGTVPAGADGDSSVGGVEDTEKGARSKESPIEYGQRPSQVIECTGRFYGGFGLEI